MKKITSILTLIVAASLLSNCTNVRQSQVNQAAPMKKKAAKTTTTGALRQVPSKPAKVTKAKTKAYPDIPLKKDTGTSPLIITKPDAAPYVR